MKRSTFLRTTREEDEREEGEEEVKEEDLKLGKKPRGIGMKGVEEHFRIRPLRTKVYVPNYYFTNRNLNSKRRKLVTTSTISSTSKTQKGTGTKTRTTKTFSSFLTCSETTHPMFLVKLVIFILWAISLTRAADTASKTTAATITTVSSSSSIKNDKDASSSPYSSSLLIPFYSPHDYVQQPQNLRHYIYPERQSKFSSPNPNPINNENVHHYHSSTISKDAEHLLVNNNNNNNNKTVTDFHQKEVSLPSIKSADDPIRIRIRNARKLSSGAEQEEEEEEENKEGKENGDQNAGDGRLTNTTNRKNTGSSPSQLRRSRSRSRRNTFPGSDQDSTTSTSSVTTTTDSYTLSHGKTAGSGSLQNSENAILNEDLNSPRKDSKQFGEYCFCWNSSDGMSLEVECSCTNLPASPFISQDVHRITVENSGNRTSDFTTLSNQNIRPYGKYLLELILNDLPFFKEIKDGTFIGMQNLHTIYVVGAPNLTSISPGVFKGFFPKLKTIKMVHTGLQETPMFNQLHTKWHLDSVDLENNKIAEIKQNWVENLKVDHLNLNYNHLRSIPEFAFKGATIARLTLKGNNNLVSLHKGIKFTLFNYFFANIESLRILDLSETAITQLPTHGLKSLEILRLEKIFTLTVIPSIFYFENLQEAAMTFPYHCCAFKYPETHDPLEFKRFQEFVSKVEIENCGTTNSPQLETIHDEQDPLQHRSSDFLKREKRHSYNSNNGQNMVRPPANTQVRRQVRRYPRQSGTSGNLAESTGAGGETMMMGTSPSSTNIDRFGLKKKSQHETGSGSSIDDSSISPISTSPSQFNHSHHHHQSHNIDYPDNFGVLKNTKNDPFDPFVFDPDRAFGSQFENVDGVDGMGSSWENDHDRAATDIDDFGEFHTGSVDEVQHKILCGNIAKKRTPMVKCSPLPDAFSPCEDIMGNNWLRVAVWFVVLFSLMGNVTVLVVLFLTLSRMNVQRLLMANLAWSDFCMGIYLFMVASEDLLSLGSYFNHAIDWQLGWGCQIAGFLTVFASELSVFTLTVITGERWYALTRAINLTKRLTIGGAAKLMAVGWLLAFVLALLPLIGVSSYSKTSICLPMEGTTVSSQFYLIFLLVFNGLAFILVSVAYLKMYRAVAGHGGGAAPAAHTADLAIAKKMALLVFTNFFCWAPVAFFGLTAVSGHPLIGVTESKFLLVFFYPLNSLMNPYLYAILTKQFRKDFYMMLSRHGMCTELAAKNRGTLSTNNTVQTMQTTLRIGSMTDSTKNAGSGGGGRMSVSSTSGAGAGSYFGQHGSGNGQHQQQNDSNMTNSPLAMTSGKFNFEVGGNNPTNDDSSPTSNSNSNSFFRLFTNNSKSPSSSFKGRGRMRQNNSKSMRDERDSIFDCDSDADGLFIDRGASAETSFISVPLSTPSDGTNSKNRRLRNYRIETRLPPITDHTDDSETVALKPITNV